MRLITEPQVYLVGRQTIDDGELQRFLNDHDVSGWETDTDVAGQKLSEVSGRLCYMSFAKPRPGGNSTYLKHILEVGHGSVLEHSVWNFIFTGVSRSFTHELVRHRTNAYSQLSQRYVDESTTDFVEPDIIANDPECHLRFLRAIHSAVDAYRLLLDRLDQLNSNITDKTARRKASRQAARCVLPNATETKIFITANARALRHFIEMRCSEFAEPEIRNVAAKVLVILQKEAPNLFGDYTWVDLPDGSRAATTTHRKV